MPVGQPQSVTFTLDQIAYRVPKGHKIRLSISNAYWPMVWPAPGPTSLALSAGSVAMPLANDSGADVTFAEPEAAPAWATKTLREASNSRITKIDQATGETTLEIHDDFGEVEDLDHGLINGSVAREWWTIRPDDPLSASGRTHWTDTNRRGDWSVRTETYSSMTSDQDNFYLSARIEAYEGDELVFEKDMTKTIARDLV